MNLLKIEYLVEILLPVEISRHNKFEPVRVFPWKFYSHIFIRSGSGTNYFEEIEEIYQHLEKIYSQIFFRGADIKIAGK